MGDEPAKRKPPVTKRKNAPRSKLVRADCLPTTHAHTMLPRLFAGVGPSRRFNRRPRGASRKTPVTIKEINEACDEADAFACETDELFDSGNLCRGHTIYITRPPPRPCTQEECFQKMRAEYYNQKLAHGACFERAHLADLQRRVAAWHKPEATCEQCSIQQQQVLFITMEAAVRAPVHFRQCSRCAL